MRLVPSLSVLCLGLGLASCAAPPPPPPPTIVHVTVTASPDVNPDENGRASPVTVRLDQLGSTGTFSKADFFQLYGHEQAVLAADFVSSDDLILAPGQSKTLTIEAKSATKAIGVVVAYRSIDKSSWRQVWTPPPNKTSSLTVTVGKLGVTAAGG